MTAAETRATVAALDEACLALVRLGAARRRACGAEAPALESARVAARREAALVALLGLHEHDLGERVRPPGVVALVLRAHLQERVHAWQLTHVASEIAELIELANGEGVAA